MPDTTVQPVQQAGQGTQPNLPAAQETPSFLNTDPADLTFALDEQTGQLSLVPKTQVTSPTSDVPQEDVRFQAAVESSQTQHPTEPNPLEERIGKMEGLMTQMASFLQGIVQGQGNLSNLNQQSQQQDEVPDLSEGIDGAGLIKIINAAVEKALSGRLNNVEGQLAEHRLRAEYNDAAIKYGQDFINVTPAMVEIKKSDPNVPWDVLYKAMQMARNSNGKSTASDSTIRSDNGSTQSGKPQSAQNLIQRAQQLKTENDGQPNMVINDKPKITTVNQAFDKALADLGFA